MKNHIPLLVSALLALAGTHSQAQTLNWGSEVMSSMVDSEGAALDENTFIFELGSFANGFTPDADNVDSWIANWQVFDRAAYDQGYGVFTSSVQILNDGTSNSTFETPLAQSFAGLEAYLWVRNDDNPVEGSEWLLTRATNWVFPTPDPTDDCCDTGIVEWSVSDLDGGNIPVWGGQDGVNGSGYHTDNGIYTLQTFTFVPEPSSTLLAGLAGVLLLLRRRRDD